MEEVKMELIDKKHLFDGICDMFCDRPYIVNITKEVCRKAPCSLKEIINNEPVVDAKPVVHGRWENVHTISAGSFLKYREVFTESRCSVCGRWTVRLARCINDSYCPHCGADMRGEKDGTD